MNQMSNEKPGAFYKAGKVHVERKRAPWTKIIGKLSRIKDNNIRKLL